MIGPLLVAVGVRVPNSNPSRPATLASPSGA